MMVTWWLVCVIPFSMLLFALLLSRRTRHRPNSRMLLNRTLWVSVAAPLQAFYEVLRIYKLRMRDPSALMFECMEPAAAG